MQAVALGQAEVGGDAVEEEGIEQHAVFGRQLGIDALEGLIVIGAEIGRRAHAAQQNGDMAVGQALEDLVQGVARHLRIDPAQHVVGAELEDDGVGSRRHRPVEAGKPVGGGIAGNAGILDLRGDSLVGKRGLQARHEAILGGQAETCRQRVAERHDLDRLRGVRAGTALSRPAAQRYKPPHARFGAEFSGTHMIGHRPRREGQGSAGNMNDTSGHPFAGDAIVLSGVNLVARRRRRPRSYPQRYRPEYRTRRGRGAAWTVGFRQVDAAHGDDRTGAARQRFGRRGRKDLAQAR